MGQKDCNEALEYLSSKLPKKHDIAIILGSGWGDVPFLLEGDRVQVPYTDIPSFPKATTKGHSGGIISGQVAGRKLLIFQGRFHYYEGYAAKELSLLPVIAKAFGTKILIVTNSSGGISEDLSPGSIVIINDHINLLGFNPLRGMNKLSESIFLDMSEAYSIRLRKLAHELAGKIGIKLHDGVFACVQGPTYETPAEVRLLKGIGADIVSMSTVPEVIVAKYLGLEVLGISCVANVACSSNGPPINHDDVLSSVGESRKHFIPLLKEIITSLPLDSDV